MPQFNVAPEQVAVAELPTPEVSQSFADGNLTVTLVFPMNYPDEAIQISEREKDGVTRTTSKTYGKAAKLSLGLVDGDGNLMRISAKVFAPNPAEEKAAAAAADDTE